MHLKRGGLWNKMQMYKQSQPGHLFTRAVALVGDDTQVEVVAKEDACLTSPTNELWECWFDGESVSDDLSWSVIRPSTTVEADEPRSWRLRSMAPARFPAHPPMLIYSSPLDTAAKESPMLTKDCFWLVHSPC